MSYRKPYLPGSLIRVFHYGATFWKDIGEEPGALGLFGRELMLVIQDSASNENVFVLFGEKVGWVNRKDIVCIQEGNT